MSCKKPTALVILDGLSQLQLSWVCERISILMSASSKHLSSFHPASRTGLFSLLAEFGEYAEDEVATSLRSGSCPPSPGLR